MQRTQQLAHLPQVEARKMSQVILYRQNWMATLQDLYECKICGKLATEAKYLENENGCIIDVS